MAGKSGSLSCIQKVTVATSTLEKKNCLPLALLKSFEGIQ